MLRVMTFMSFILASLLVNADDKDQATDFFIKLYNKTCVQYANRTAELAQQFIQSATPELSAQKAKMFLGGGKGQVWVIPNLQGDFVVVTRDDNQCMVYARQIDTHQLIAAFNELMAQGPAPFIVTQTSGDNLKGLISGPHQTIGYQWRTAERTEQFLFSLGTAERPSSQIQAVASVMATK